MGGFIPSLYPPQGRGNEAEHGETVSLAGTAAAGVAKQGSDRALAWREPAQSQRMPRAQSPMTTKPERKARGTWRVWERTWQCARSKALVDGVEAAPGANDLWAKVEMAPPSRRTSPCAGVGGGRGRFPAWRAPSKPKLKPWAKPITCSQHRSHTDRREQIPAPTGAGRSILHGEDTSSCPARPGAARKTTKAAAQAPTDHDFPPAATPSRVPISPAMSAICRRHCEAQVHTASPGTGRFPRMRTKRSSTAAGNTGAQTHRPRSTAPRSGSSVLPVMNPGVADDDR